RQRRIKRRLAYRLRFSALQPPFRRRERRLDRLLRFVKALPRRRLIRLVDAAEPLLRRLQPPSLRAEEFNPRRLQRSGIRRSGEGSLRFTLQGVEIADKCRQGHEGVPQADRASRAFSTTASNAAASEIAISESVLRSRSIAAFFSPAISSL